MLLPLLLLLAISDFFRPPVFAFSFSYVQFQPKVFNPQVNSQGYSVAVSNNGKTFVVGAPYSSNSGAILIYSLDEMTHEFVQQGPVLIGAGSGINSIPEQGFSVAISGDGLTIIFGGIGDDYYQGATWIFTQNSSGYWTQQGPKLVGSDSVGSRVSQSSSVAIDFYGNTALIGGFADDYYTGAAWIFTRNTTTKQWTQQSPKLVGGNNSFSFFGYASSLSSNGSLAVVSARYDGNGALRILYVYARDEGLGIWNLQSVIYSGYNASIISPPIGPDVAMSADAQTILLGVPWDDDYAGASLVFVYNASVHRWYRQAKLVGMRKPSNSSSREGSSVSLSSDGNFALIGGPDDDYSIGGAWVFSRDGFGNWNQVGGPLRGSGAVGTPQQGKSVSLSGDASIAVVAGSKDGYGVGATWVFSAVPITTQPTTSPTTLK